MNADEIIKLLEGRREHWRARLQDKNFNTELGLLETCRANALVDELSHVLCDIGKTIMLKALKGGE